MRQRSLGSVVVIVAVVVAAGPALPCGGPDIFAPTVSLRLTPTALVSDDYEGLEREPFRFLDPARLAHIAGADELAHLAYGDSVAAKSEAEIDAAPLHAAVRRGDWAVAGRLARALIDAILTLPAPRAQPHAPDLRFAVEIFELAPGLAGIDAREVEAALSDASSSSSSSPVTSPILLEAQAIHAAPFADAARTLDAHKTSRRKASLELAALRNRITELPSGWPPLSGVTNAAWTSLLADHDRWLKEHADHPLADLARLQKLRVLYLKGDVDDAWKLLVDLYRRRPARALWEMRHLVQHGQTPRALPDDPVLATSLVRPLAPIAPDAWTALWKKAAAAPSAPWSENLEERLLAAASVPDVLAASPSASSAAAAAAASSASSASSRAAALPEGFPALAFRPTERWAQLRTIALVRAGRGDDAVKQAALLDVNASADLIASAWLAAGKPAQAAQVKGVDARTVRWLVHVAVGDDELATLAHGRTAVSKVAAEALAIRKLGDGADDGNGDWISGAAALDVADPPRAALWRQAAAIAVDASAAGRIKLARFLLAHRGGLFDGMDNAYSRGLKWMLADGDDVEQQRLRAWLLRGGERQTALASFGAALVLEPRGNESALRDADRTYNALKNADYAEAQRYDALLDRWRAVKNIRAAGASIRGKH